VPGRRCNYTDGCFSSAARAILEGQAERNGEAGELLSGAWEQYRREKWNALFQETKIALSVSAASVSSDLCFEKDAELSVQFILF